MRRTVMSQTPSHSNIVPPLLTDYVPRLFTAADMAAMPEDLPSGSVRYELHYGRLITMPPPGDQHGAVGLNVAGALLVQGQWQGHGKARDHVGVLLARNPDHVLGPDAVFMVNRQLPQRVTPEGYLETIPALVVEVRSKNDTLAATERKAEEYLQAGSVVVWVVDPIKRNVVEYRQNTPPHVWGENEMLKIDDIIPGFALLVSDALRE